MRWIKNLLQGIAGASGYRITRIRKTDDATGDVTNPYGAVLPFATYRPWNKDRSFQSMFAVVEAFTLVDKYRCWELWTLIEQVAKLKSGSIIEIGVWRGGTGALIAERARNCGIQEKIFLCDTFTGVVKAGEHDSSYKGGEHADTSRQVVEDLLFSRVRLDNVEILEGIFPDQTGHRVQDLRFRFCHIDVDVYRSAKEIVDWIWERLVPGGIMVYDDYGFDGCIGITKYVEEQMLLTDRLVMHNLNGHAIIVKL